MDKPSGSEVKKETLRFTVDFSELNENGDLDEFDLPRINELNTSCKDWRFYLIIDFKDGFFNIAIKKEEQEKTTFSC